MPDTVLEGTTQESFQQSLVEIGSIVSEDKIFLKLRFGPLTKMAAQLNLV
jgi:hypothetical protein